MGRLRGWIRRLERVGQDEMSHFDLADGTRYYFDPQEAFKATFLFFSDSMHADHAREPRPEPPEIVRAVVGARDRSEALSRVMGGSSHLPLDREALVERGEFIPRSLVAGREYGDLGVLED